MHCTRCAASLRLPSFNFVQRWNRSEKLNTRLGFHSVHGLHVRIGELRERVTSSKRPHDLRVQALLLPVKTLVMSGH